MNTTLGIVIWIGAVCIIAALIIRAKRKQSFTRLGLWIAILLVTALALSTINSGLIFIRPQERGVVLSALAAKGYRAYTGLCPMPNNLSFIPSHARRIP